MEISRRIFLHLAASAAALPAMPGPASAQAYPSRPARILTAAGCNWSARSVLRPMTNWS